MIGIFRWCGWLNILPAVYDDSMSYYEVLTAVTHKLNEVIAAQNTADDEMAEFVKQLNEFVTDYNTFKDGEQGRWDAYMDAFLDANYQRFVGELAVHSVYFGLNDDGYFVAYIPENWSDITFDTDMNYDSENYGRLLLMYDVDSPTTGE